MLDKLKKFFQGDTFAISLGIEIVKAENGMGECTIKKRADLMNANDVLQGGALYTLADFTFAVGAASTGKLCVTSTVSASYVKPAKGNDFRAVATPINLGRTLYTYDVEVFDESRLVAKFTITGCVLGEMNL
ncbi:MAG: PaaI family thioesterase [Clostridia bacterium]|nr:PaaI family thioesterase [Clostridia bacterium]